MKSLMTLVKSEKRFCSTITLGYDKIIAIEEIWNVKKEQENNLKKHLNVRDKLYYKKKNINTDEEKDAVYKKL